MITTLSREYRHKVKTVAELLEILGARPRKKRVVMCHGVFDLVHPGHIRHLLYAKSKVDVLVVSITSDVHITKGAQRPFVPQDLRALNLAALEMVDFVTIDPQATPLENLALLQPDYFAKGYEYVAGGLKPMTLREQDVLGTYGGELMFTPGDIVYSSSAIINSGPPRLAIEKVLTLMEVEGINFDRIRSTLGKFPGLAIHVVGDTIVDSLTHTTMIGGMTKTPTSSVRFDNRTDFIGGAAIVAAHLSAAGARVKLSTVLGGDALGEFVQAELARVGVECQPIIDSTRPTTHKNVFICGDYRLLKVDNVDNRAISTAILCDLSSQIEETSAQAVVFCDFRHGVFNRRTIPELVGAIPSKCYRVADSQVASRWGNILDFPGFDLLTPNEREARFALADQDTGVRPLAAQLLDEAGCKLLVLKLGQRGVLACRSGESDVRSFFVVDSFAEKVVDAVGAGDAFLAYSTMAMLADGSDVVACILGSLAAAHECEVEGNRPVHLADVSRKIDTVESQANYGLTTSL